MDLYDGIDRGIISFCTRILFKVIIFIHFGDIVCAYFQWLGMIKQRWPFDVYDQLRSELFKLILIWFTKQKNQNVLIFVFSAEIRCGALMKILVIDNYPYIFMGFLQFWMASTFLFKIYAPINVEDNPWELQIFENLGVIPDPWVTNVSKIFWACLKIHSYM